MKPTMIKFALAAAMTISPAAFGATNGNPGPGQGGGPPVDLQAVRVQVTWSQAMAKPFNADPIQLILIVTDYQTGATIANLTSVDFHFKFMEYGCLGTYGAQISQFTNTGTGVYHVQLKPHPNGGCSAWQATENHSVEVVVYAPPTPFVTVGRYGITAMRIEIQ